MVDRANARPQQPDARTRIRRRDRAMPDDKAIAEALIQGQVAFVGTCADDQPFVLPNLYWYDPDKHTVYFHTATEGRTRSNVESNPKVCLSVATMGKLLSADTAYEFSVEYSSVCVFGNARVIDDEQESRHGLQGLLDKYFPDHTPGEDYREMTLDEISRTAVFAVEIESWSGKQKVAEK